MQVSNSSHDGVGKPYAAVGSGRLSSLIWKSGSEESGWRYRFNVFRIGANGRVEQRLSPSDLRRLVSLTRVLALVLLDDGCLSDDTRSELAELVAILDQAVGEAESGL